MTLQRAADIQPFVNGFIALCVLIVAIVILMVILKRSSSWQGPTQAARLDSHESRISHLERRQGAAESNMGIQFRALSDSLDGLRGELAGVAENAARIGRMATDISQLATESQDIEQLIQAFVDLGCGADGCPRVRRVEDKNA